MTTMLISHSDVETSVTLCGAAVLISVNPSATKITAAYCLGDIAAMLDRDGNFSARDAVMSAAGEIDEEAAVLGFDDFFIN